MDCHALDVPGDGFDLTASQFGVMLVPDQPRGARRNGSRDQARRAGARLAYGFPAQFEALQGFTSALELSARELAVSRTIRNGRAAKLLVGAGDVGLEFCSNRSSGLWLRISISRRTNKRDCGSTSATDRRGQPWGLALAPWLRRS